MLAESDENRSSATKYVPICAIGASAGGVTALQSLFRQLPPNLGLAYVVILHLAPEQPSALSEILSACTRLSVLQVSDSPKLKPNCVYVIPPDRELVIEGDNVSARPFAEPRGRRAPIDVFFRSVASARGDGVAMVLSGAGADGAAGVRAVKEAGGVVMVQEPAEAEFASMPQNAIATGAVDFVDSVAVLAERLGEVARSKEAVRSLDLDGGANDLRRIVGFLRSRTGHDFSGYKRATVMRRVMRRMQVCRATSVSAYADHLMTTPEEAKELFADLLISVTMFFRDARAFEALQRFVIKPLFDDADLASDDGLRAWVVGCATGEEAYSLAILIAEEAERRRIQIPVQIFATDLDDGALATAREGRYPKTIEADVSDERLARFFVNEGSYYRVRKEVRDTVLFANHSVLKEPPFMRLDLISCRNLLIYLERSLQQQVCSIFHYGLRPGRYLFLGSAETADTVAELFNPLEREARIYIAKPTVAPQLPILPQFPSPERLLPAHPTSALAPAVQPGALHVKALEEAAPPSALVDDQQNILHLSDTVGRFILHSAGPLSNRLAAVVRPELRLDLKLALDRALVQRLATTTHPAPVSFDGERRRVSLHVRPVSTDDRTGAQALVFFLDGGPAPEEPDAVVEAQPEEVRRLHAELKSVQEALVASRSGHDVTIEDLRATNEELQSTNEEYRSTAEELETSREELQSINEELRTVNAELKSKLEGISSAHSDLQNLTAATEIGTLFLDDELRIRMFTPPIAELFNVTRSDMGRVITDFTHRLDWGGLADEALRVLEHLAPVEQEVRSTAGRWYVLRVRPYRTIENRIEGVVLTFVDITTRREAEAALRESEERLRVLVEGVPQLVWRADPTGGWTWSSPQWSAYTGLDAAASEGLGWLEALHPDDRERTRAAWAGGTARSLVEVECRIRHAETRHFRWFRGRASPRWDELDHDVVEWLGAFTDVDDLRTLHDRQRVLLHELQHRVRNTLAVVRAIASRTGETSDTVEDFAAHLEGRLNALARTQMVLTSAPGQGVDLETMLREELLAQAATEAQIEMSGPEVRLSAKAAEVLSLAVHELATNAVKYGALSEPAGRIALEWAAYEEDGERWLRLDWSESGVRVAATAPRRKGLGTELVTIRVPYELRGRGSLDLRPGGLKAEIAFPLRGGESILQTDSPL